jgi:Xaa-Pro dipeptidase
VIENRTRAGVFNPAFSRQEYSQRVERLQKLMSARGWAALLVHNRAQLCYLTGMENCYLSAEYSALVPAVGASTLLASEFEMLNAQVGVWLDDRETFSVGEDPTLALCKVLCERNFERSNIGVQLSHVSAHKFAILQRMLPDANWTDASTLVSELMLRKSDAEIEYLREAGRLSALGFKAAANECAVGKTDNDVAAAAYNAMVRGGSEFMCMEPIVTVGERSGIPHSTFRRTSIKSGDAVFVEVAGCVCRSNAPLMRTILMEPPPDEARRAREACRHSLSTLIESIKPRMHARDAVAKAKAAWTPLCDELIWHGIYGYSVGLGFPPDWNDAPAVITEDSDLVFEPGMCFHTTTSLRSALRFGTAMGQTVLVTENGNEVLTGEQQ